MAKKLSLSVITVALLLLPALSFPVEKEGFQFKNKPEIADIKPKKPVRVKLERHESGKYTWELSGDDVDEIVRTDRRLRKLFLGEDKKE